MIAKRKIPYTDDNKLSTNWCQWNAVSCYAKCRIISSTNNFESCSFLRTIRSSLTFCLNCWVFFNKIMCSFHIAFLVLGAVKASPSRENISIRKPDPDLQLVVCRHFPPIAYCFWVIYVNSNRPLQKRPSWEDILIRKPDPDFLLMVCLYLYLEPFTSNSRFSARDIHESYDWDIGWRQRQEMTSPVCRSTMVSFKC